MQRVNFYPIRNSLFTLLILAIGAFLNITLATNRDTTHQKLVISNSNRFYSKDIKEHKRITVWLNDETKTSGRFTILSDSTIEIKSDTVLFQEISKLRAITFPAQISGLALVGIGVYFATAIIIDLTDNDNWLGFDAFAYLGIAPTFVVLSSGTYLIFNGKKYRMNEGWKITVENRNYIRIY